MMNTHTLGAHWDAFIKGQVDSGRYASEADVLRAALRELETRDAAFAALRAHVAEGAAEADRGEFVENFSIEDIISAAQA